MTCRVPAGPVSPIRATAACGVNSVASAAVTSRSTPVTVALTACSSRAVSSCGALAVTISWADPRSSDRSLPPGSLVIQIGTAR